MKAKALRHEVARLIVWQVVWTRPVVPSTVSYEVRQQGHALSNALGHGPPSHPTGARTVRGRCLCQHQAERGLDGRYGEHRCTLDTRRYRRQAKDADRLGPTGHRSGYRVVLFPCHGHGTLLAHREHLTRHCQPGGTWEARLTPSLKGGKPSGPPTAVRVGGWEKAQAVLERDGDGLQHHPTRQRADFPAVWMDERP
jgi:hypothetical protein